MWHYFIGVAPRGRDGRAKGKQWAAAAALMTGYRVLGPLWPPGPAWPRLALSVAGSAWTPFPVSARPWGLRSKGSPASARPRRPRMQSPASTSPAPSGRRPKQQAPGWPRTGRTVFAGRDCRSKSLAAQATHCPDSRGALRTSSAPHPAAQHTILSCCSLPEAGRGRKRAKQLGPAGHALGLKG